MTTRHSRSWFVFVRRFSVFEIALIGMSGINFIDLFLDISPETDFMAVIVRLVKAVPHEPGPNTATVCFPLYLPFLCLFFNKG